MRWTYIDSVGEEHYPEIQAFQNSHCFVLERLKSNANLSDVVDAVNVSDDGDDGDEPTLVISGVLSGPRIEIGNAQV